MNNIELENKIKEIINIENYFDMIIAINNFEKDYKQTDFYKTTKKSLSDVIKEAKLHYALQFTDIKNKIQNVINDLNLDKINELLDQIGITFGEENSEIRDILSSFNKSIN